VRWREQRPAVTAPVSVDLSCLLAGSGDDPAAAVDRAASIGFTAVEPWAFDRHVDAYRTALRASGASAPSGRARVIDAERPDEVFDAALELGIGVVVDGCTDAARWADAEQTARLAARVNDLAAAAHARGLRFAYRTGDVELRTSVHGTHALHVFVRHLDPRIGLDVDVFRAASAGASAALLLQVLGRRVRLLHLADGSFDSPTPRQRPLGSGGLNLLRILGAAPRAARVLVHEDPGVDVDADLRRSLRWLDAHQTPATHRTTTTTAPPTEGTP
jgi:sugar phosphate isomerase/epimerase